MLFIGRLTSCFFPIFRRPVCSAYESNRWEEKETFSQQQARQKSNGPPRGVRWLSSTSTLHVFVCFVWVFWKAPDDWERANKFRQVDLMSFSKMSCCCWTEWLTYQRMVTRTVRDKGHWRTKLNIVLVLGTHTSRGDNRTINAQVAN